MTRATSSTELMNYKILIPFLGLSAAGLPALYLAAVSGGAGHGSYFWAKVLFPYPMIATLITGSLAPALILLALVQFPVYGLIIGNSWLNGRLRATSAVLLIVHALAAGACLMGFVSDNFEGPSSNVPQADRLVASGVHPGQNRQEVEAWLASRGIRAGSAHGDTSYLVLHRRDEESAREWMDMLGNQTVAELAGLDGADVHSIIRLSNPVPVRPSFFGHMQVKVYFFFDANDRLIRYWVTEFSISV